MAATGSHYHSNLADIRFNLFEVFDRGALLGTGAAEDMDTETALAALQEIDHLCREKISAPFADGDRNPPIYDPKNHSVTIPESTKAAFKAYQDSDWWRLELPAELDGQPTPPTVRWAAMELVLAANPPALYMYAAGPKFSQVMYYNGTERDKKIAKIAVERQWGGATMVLTEPDAGGSDVGGAGRTKAYPQPDGTWHIEGVKRFITSGDQDMTDNILHYVLARPVGVEGVGGPPGTKGAEPVHRAEVRLRPPRPVS